MSAWTVYILECSDRTLYTGCTNDLAKRLRLHNAGQGAKYTRARLPVKLVYEEPAVSRSGALRRECEIKKFPRSRKENLFRKS